VTLQVPFDRFAEALRGHFGGDEAFVSAHPEGAVVTAANPGRTGALAAVAPFPPDEARRRLEEAGLRVSEGEWIADGALRSLARPQEGLYVAAVAYPTDEGRPGLWVDAFDRPPTETEAIQAMYREFVATGEIPTVVGFEEFLRLVSATVVVVGPDELLAYSGRKATAKE
jgi:hypothetical protein